jgi:endoglucanase
MAELKEHLKQLLSLPGLSGYEAPVREVIAGTWKPLVDELTVSRIGSLHALKKGTGAEPRPRILLSAHMDAIGMIVTTVEDGLLHFTGIGGIDARILPGQPVVVHGRREIPGMVVQPPGWLLPEEQSSSQTVEMQYLFVDTGLRPAEVNELVRIGDLISFSQPPIELSEDWLAGHSLDNRASVAAVTVCLQELQRVRHIWDVWAVASVQEEVTLGGAITSPVALRPDLAIAMDVTFGRGPGSPSDHSTFPLGKGIALGWGANIHPALTESFKKLADRLDIPYKMEFMPRMSGTDAMALQVALEGIPTMVLSMPIRYMHSPVEVVSLKDISRTGHLMAQFIAGLEADFGQALRWEDQE